MDNIEAKIWAKSANENNKNGISLLQHIEDILRNINEIKTFIGDNKLYELIKIAVILHDLGKALPYFQIRTLGNKNYCPFEISTNLPHSIFSLFLIDKIKLEEKIKQIYPEDAKEYKQFVLSAVAYHHWRNNFEEVIRYSIDEIENLLNENLQSEIEKNLKEELRDFFNGYAELIKFDKTMLTEIINGAQIEDYAIPPYSLYWLPKRISFEKVNLVDWVKLSGFLIRCDHFASFCESENNYEQPIEFKGIEYEKIKSKLKDKFNLDDEKKIWQVKLIEEKKLSEKNVILVAPTGSGKTEFSYIWSKGEKTFYTLPLRSAVNQIFERSQQLFNDEDERVGLLHSDADVYLLGDGNETENLKSYYLARQLSYPFMVSTGDQFFPYALRPPSYEKIYATFSYSRLVIDEVQAYDPKAAAIIVRYLQDIYKMGGKFLLITATMPDFIREELKNRIKDEVGEKDFELIDYYDKATEVDYSSIKKHKLKFIKIKNNENEFEYDKIIDEIIDKSYENNGQRVLVVVNTVKLAVDVFDKIKKNVGEKMFVELLHSRLTYEKRKEKENLIVKEFSNPKPLDENIPKIVVATQVVEASLDLDADILYTEFVPIDSLVQRMGRVLRRYKTESPSNLESPNVFVTIFENGIESGGNNVYSNDLIEISLKLFSKTESDLETDKWLDKNGKYKKKSKDWRNKKTVDEFFKTIKKLEPEALILSELEKKELVKKLYNPKIFAVSESYLTTFYKTLDILDSGFMAERKDEAHRIFREISSISVIPKTKLEELIKSINEFFEKNSDNKNLYVKFKKVILNRFVVNVYFPKWKYDEIRFREDIRLSYQLVNNENNFDNHQEKLINKWCRNIFIVKTEYDEETGILKYDFPEYNPFI